MYIYIYYVLYTLYMHICLYGSKHCLRSYLTPKIKPKILPKKVLGSIRYNTCEICSCETRNTKCSEGIATAKKSSQISKREHLRQDSFGVQTWAVYCIPLYLENFIIDRQLFWVPC